LKKINNLNKLASAGVVAVVRGNSEEEAIKAVQAVISGGIKGIELTFTVPHADKVIAELKSQYQENKEIVIGAGTVLDAITARLAIMAGAEFIVSPSFDLETAQICNLYQIPYLPGCMTVTEIQTALKSGVDIVKLFPGSAFGPKMVKALKGPVPYVDIMPTGGVSLENMEEWFKSGVICVGVGGNLFSEAPRGNFDKVTEMAKLYMERYYKIQKGVS